MAAAEPPKRIYISHGLSGAGVLAPLRSALLGAGYEVLEDSATPSGNLEAALRAMMANADGAVVIVTPGSLRSLATARELSELRGRALPGFPVVALLGEDIELADVRSASHSWLTQVVVLPANEVGAAIAALDVAFEPAKAPRVLAESSYSATRAHLVGAPVTSVAIGALEGQVAVFAGAEDGEIHGWQVEGPLHHRTTGSVGAVWSIAVDPDRPEVLYSGGQDGSVRQCVLPDAPKALYQHDGIVNAVAVKSGGQVASGGDDNQVVLWSPGDSKPVRALSDDFVTAIAFAGKHDVLFLSDRTLRAWRPNEVLALATPATPTAIARSGTTVVVGHDDGTVETRDQRTWHALTSWRFEAPVESVAIAGRSVAVGDERGTVWLWETDTNHIHRLTGHTGAVRGVALGELYGDLFVASGSEDGEVRIWSRPQTDHVEWVGDAPADEDWLQRKPLARVVAQRLRRVDEREPGSSFLVHIDAPWGAGKSTLLGFLRKDLDQDFTTVPFDAWREAGVGPAWWALLTSLRTAVRKQRKWPGRVWLRITESLARLRRVGAPVVLAFTVLLAVAGGVLWWFTDFKGATEIVKTITGGLVGLSTLWAGALVASRFLLWDSARGARLFEQSNTNPMLEVDRHFGWLMARSKRPVVFLIDDLDRCKENYVVELLDSVQTLIRDTGPPNIHFIVSADGAWLRVAYEQAYERFSTQVAEPGRPLGYLFLDKFFQLRVPLPAADRPQREGFLRRLLRGASGVDAAVRAEEQRVRASLNQTVTEDDVVSALSSASPEVRGLVAEDALRRLSSPEAVAATEHSLQRFAGLLPANPRAMKRFVNTYSALRAVRTLEGSAVPVETLALWTILETRWPGLAEHLRRCPDAVEKVGANPEDVPEELRAVFSEPGVVALVGSQRWGALGAAEIRACVGNP
ncbi:P-loop NTPase fold protein [Actinokineospora auranticolor]|uniref:WD domain G-beta repeat uncharacterized protein n=1 Tax=Actinokineospora auranticolor TaxID=155976 RepID=A0A2S6GFV4_9PSEU|nr:P-loop NTPase fold protein [Actinokineospora auranticolor]PPK64090.1 WD domain G-beta repeat uncharacterized protein [Actinokineospora auranticolor]